VVAEIVAALAIVAVMGLYLLWTAQRLDRLHARVDAAAAALDGQLSRRGASITSFSSAVRLADDVADELRSVAAAAAAVPGLGHDREVVENAVTHALARAVATSPRSFAAPSAAGTELHDEALRASFARGFYNDTVRDALVIRDRRLVRWLRLAGHAPHPAYFEMDDEELPVSRISVAPGPTIEA
jgi:hypothetical protein